MIITWERWLILEKYPEYPTSSRHLITNNMVMLTIVFSCVGMRYNSLTHNGMFSFVDNVSVIFGSI